jgi:hypothetical protein
MSIRSRRRRERWVMLTWGLVGLGFGLMLLSTVMWLKQDGTASGWRDDSEQAQAMAPLVTQWRQGQLPKPGTGSANMAAWTPLVGALHKLQTQRAQALAQYEAQVKDASPSAWLVPEQLVLPAGRQVLATKLLQLDRALSTWTQREAMIQAEFDSAMNAWFQQAPEWLDLDARQQMMEASGEAARVVHAYVQLEQDLLAQIRHLSNHIDSLGDRVSLARTAQDEGGPELVFAQEVDFNRYQSSVARLAELAEQEQSQMALIRQVDRQHLAHLADAIESSMMVP